MADIFAHVINRIDLIEGVVRLELAVMVPGTPEPVLEPRQIVHLPLNGFLRSAATVEGFLGELAKAGVVRPADTAPAPQPRGVTASPNFG